jgi:hypothetical protein
MGSIAYLWQSFQSGALILNFGLQERDIVDASLLIGFVGDGWDINIVEIIHPTHLQFQLF